MSSGTYQFSVKTVSEVKLALEFQSSPITVHRYVKADTGDPTAASSDNLKETWNSEQIADFVRKLGLLDSHEETEDSVKTFLQLHAVCLPNGCIGGDLTLLFLSYRLLANYMKYT